jgi:V/A-type H+-transporting ATPase subunit D
MSTVRLSKAALSEQAAQLKVYRAALPSLDLKRRQLMLENARQKLAQQELIASIKANAEKVGTHLPLLADTPLDLEGLVTLKTVTLRHENIVGVILPTLDAIEVEVAPYSFMVLPHWVDSYVAIMRERLELEQRYRISHQRLDTLARALTKITQRVNLFQNVLIPRTLEALRRIRIALADIERAAVVRSKLAKKKQRQGRGE